MSSLLSLNITDGAVVTIFVVASIGTLLYLVSHRIPVRWADDGLPSNLVLRRRWVAWLLIAAVAGALAGVGILLVCEVMLNLFGMPLELDTHTWVVACFAAIGLAVLNIWKSRWWRKVVASVGILVFICTATVAINASYGLNPTVASLIGVQNGVPIALPAPEPTKIAPTPTAIIPPPPPKPIYQTWNAPAGMPATGKYGTVDIPNTVSGFVARPAYLYLPPAALVPNAPDLPILIMMMGQPGGPESSAKFLSTLNSMAAAHQGLGAIVLTVDQIGSPTQNPMCIDSPRGNSYSYVMKDVLNYVHKELRVASGRTNWAIGGYSNGGECALSFGAKHPEIFGSILDISGEISPSLGSVKDTVRFGFGGDQARYDEEQPLNIMARTHYTDMLAIFTSGGNDHFYGPESDTALAAAKAAGMTTLRFIGANVGHRSDAIVYGMPVGMNELYPRWLLAAPKG